MNKNWLIAGAIFGCLGGGSLGACGQEGTGAAGSANVGGASSSAAGPASSSSTAAASSDSSSSAASSSSSGAGGGDGGMPCSKPSKLFPPLADAGTTSLICPFSGADGGKDIYCNYATQHCCEPGTGTASCDPVATPCAAADTDWKCDDPSQCGPGQVCCGTGTVVKTMDPNCANTAKSFKGTRCAAACAATEITMCTSDAECGAGKTCLPFRTHGNQVGACN